MLPIIDHAAHQAQERTRKDFRDGRIDVLLSTNVGAEGLDFR